MMTNAKYSMKCTVLAAAIAALSPTANAAGLGKLTVLSALGQPLNAELELMATRDELSSMNARLAPNEAFKQAGIEFVPVLAGIKFNIAKRADGKSYIRLSTDRPINEPFIDLLVQLDWGQGRLIREYTFLLDPPEAVMARQKVAPVTPPESGSKVVPPARPAESRPQPAATSAASATREVKRGDTLGRIATETKPEGVGLNQMLVALFQSNKEAFIRNNMNRLRAGAILTIPDRDAAVAVSPKEAQHIVIAQAADFNAYRRRVAAAAAAAAPEEGAPQQAATGKIAPRIEEKAPASAAEARDQLKVSKSEAAKAAQANQARITSLEEDKVAKEKALQEANSRVSELEKNVGELQKLLEMKNQQLAELQGQAAKSFAPGVGEGKKLDSAAAPAVKPAPTAAAVEAKPGPEAAQPVPTQGKAAAPASAEEKPTAGAIEKPAETTPKPAEVAQAPAAQPAAEAPPATKPETPKPAAAPKQPTSAPPAEGGGFLAGLMDNPLALYGGGGALAGLLGLLGYRMLQRRKQDVPAPATEGKMAAQSVFGATGGQSVDTSASSIQTDFSHSGMTAIDADEGVDPVAEADVYMAYGRDAQAEEILLDALKSEPTRHAIHVKLMEVYAQRKSLKQFENQASELYAQTGGVGADWEKAAAMGRKLDPANPLYGGKPTPEPVVAAAPATGVSGALAGAAVAAGGAVAGFAAATESGAVNRAEAATADEVSDRLTETWAMQGGFDAVGMGEESAEVATSEQSTILRTPSATPEVDFDLELPALKADSAAQGQDADVGALDFDLGLDLATPPTVASVLSRGSASAVPPNPRDTVMAATAESSSEPRETAATAAADKSEAFSGTESLVARNVIDFDLGAAAEPEVAAQAPAPKPGVPVMDLERTDVAGTLIDFNLDELTASRPSNDIAVMDLERTDVGGNLLDFNFELEEGKGPGAKESAPALDLSGVNLDLPATEQIAPLPTGGEEPAAVPDFEAALAAGENPEVATKIELAKAYEEMGDREGARELLQEVVTEGTASQQQRARDMIAALG